VLSWGAAGQGGPGSAVAELVRRYRTLEARGEIRGGRFVDGLIGGNTLPDAVDLLRRVRRTAEGQ
jgi:ATP-dependent Lhr-like helicase